MALEMTSNIQRTPSAVPSSFPSLLSRFSSKRHAQFVESTKLERTIKANLKGLGYGG